MIPKYFNYVLEYLRAKENEGFVLLNDKKIGSFILKEAKYYHIEGLIDKMENFLKIMDK